MMNQHHASQISQLFHWETTFARFFQKEEPGHDSQEGVQNIQDKNANERETEEGHTP
jgi:hypothetical protein